MVVFCISVPFSNSNWDYMSKWLWKIIDIHDHPASVKYYGNSKYEKKFKEWADMLFTCKFISSLDVNNDIPQTERKISPKSIIPSKRNSKDYSKDNKNNKKPLRSSPKKSPKSSPKGSPKIWKKWTEEIIEGGNYIIIFCGEKEIASTIFRYIDSDIKKVLISI